MRIFGFEYFSPLDGKLPAYCTSKFSDIAYRARQMLMGKTTAIMEYAIEEINWILVEDDRQQYLEMDKQVKEAQMKEEMGEDVKDDEYYKKVARFFPSDVAHLERCMHRFTDLNQLSWPQYFSVFALSLIEGACEEEYVFAELPEEGRDLHRTQFHYIRLGSYLAEATEAIAIAEQIGKKEIALLRMVDNIEEKKKMVSIKNSKAAIKRHAKTNELLKQFVRFYAERKFPSMTQAAKKFVESVPKELYEHLAKDGVIRTLTKGLSSTKKGKRHLYE